MQGDHELIKLLDYKPDAAQVSVALEWLSGISNDDSHVADALMPLLHPNLSSSPEAPRTTTLSGAWVGLLSCARLEVIGSRQTPFRKLYRRLLLPRVGG
jgi:hypothetical protein